MSRLVQTGAAILLAAVAGFLARGNRDASIRELAEKELRLGNFSVSLAVKDLKAAVEFYEKLGFRRFADESAANFVIMQNDSATIGLFQGMFDRNILTFNPGWDRSASAVEEFDDIRAIQQHLREQGIEPVVAADPQSDGPAHCMVVDPDGNQILLDQHVPRPKK